MVGEAAGTVGRRQLAWFVVPMVVFAVSANVANALSPTLLIREPVWLIALSSRLRWLVLVSPRLDPLTFFAIPFVRLSVVALVYYFFGLRYGERAVTWLETKMGGVSRPILWIERQFHRTRYAVLLLIPAGPFVSLLAGADRMRWQTFFAFTTTGLLVRLVIVRLVAGAFTGPILDVTNWVADNQLWLTGVSVVSVLGFVWWGRRSGRGEIESVEEVAEELGEV